MGGGSWGITRGLGGSQPWLLEASLGPGLWVHWGLVSTGLLFTLLRVGMGEAWFEQVK